MGADGSSIFVAHLTLNCRAVMAYAAPDSMAARKRRQVGLWSFPDTPSNPDNTDVGGEQALTDLVIQPDGKMRSAPCRGFSLGDDEGPRGCGHATQ